MPRASKGARLYLEPAQRDRQGKIIRPEAYVIRDGKCKRRTGIPRGDVERANAKLAEYLGTKHEVSRERNRAADQILIADALNIYYRHKVLGHGGHARPEETKRRIATLDAFWKDDTLADIDGQRCREFVRSRVGQSWKSAKPDKTGRPPRLVTAAAARRELEDLRAAINYQIAEGYCREVVKVWLPEKPSRREGCLTRSDAARLLWAAWRAKQIMRDNVTAREVGKHIARFILIGLYTGTRHGAVCAAATVPAIGRSYVDLENGIFYRLAKGKKATNKRQPPVRLPPKLLDHLRRWHRVGASQNAVVEWNGRPISSVRKGFASAVRAAGLDPNEITPHTLRHTAATWLMQNGTKPALAAEYLGMSEATLVQNYFHLHPGYQSEAVDAFSKKRRRA
jgi:integrase